MYVFKNAIIWILIVIIFLLIGCATYYQINQDFQEYIENGELEKANQLLDKDKNASKDKNRLLYFLQKGVVLQLLENYSESNQYFEKAYIFTEDYRKNYSTEAASLLINPTVKPYTGEDHELVLMHYFKATNYMMLKQQDEALVECRRINNKLNLLNDRYQNNKNRYKKDAFALNLMGISYEVAGDINNAFIAYRNAYWAYDEAYKIHFATEVPLQLKKDLLRSAYLNGFIEELNEFENKFGMKYEHHEQIGGELVFFWHNGLGPIKDEWSINFVIVKGAGGIVLFENEELGLSFPFPLPPMGQGNGGLGDLKFVRVAFPRYLERKPYYNNAEIILNNQNYKLELAENINEIAYKTLEDRMLRELANSLLRLAIKQAAEQQVRKQNQNLGALLSVVNALSEKADTRNWQTLPYSISYARIPLAEGNNKVKLRAFSSNLNKKEENKFEFNVVKGQTIFQIHHSLKITP